jgi:hypothetical protein
MVLRHHYWEEYIGESQGESTVSYTPKPDELRGHVRRLQAIEAYLRQIASNVQLRGADKLVNAAGFVETAIRSNQSSEESTDWLDQ